MTLYFNKLTLRSMFLKINSHENLLTSPFGIHTTKLCLRTMLRKVQFQMLILHNFPTKLTATYLQLVNKLLQQTTRTRLQICRVAIETFETIVLLQLVDAICTIRLLALETLHWVFTDIRADETDEVREPFDENFRLNSHF